MTDQPAARKTVVMTFRLTEEEAAVIKAAADFYGITVSSFSRDAALDRTNRLMTITVNGVKVQ